MASEEDPTKSCVANDTAAQEQPAALTGAKREAEKPPATSDAVGDEEGPEVRLVEMPVEHVMWILGQRRENHPTTSIDDFEQYRTKDDDPAEPTIFSQRDMDALIAMPRRTYQPHENRSFVHVCLLC
ncbi:hypothetical protein ACP70R_007431 [Stipagrostis hirtigluma subsp. patula]